MGEAEAIVDRAEHHARRITRAARPWIERLARYGYAAKGVVYVLYMFVEARYRRMIID